MPSTPKTIQIFLPHGDPRGIRIAEITTRIVQVIEIPRSLLGEFLKMPESQQVAMYFLVGNDEDKETPKVYVGQTGGIRNRLISHNKKKDFWERALVVISRTNSLTQTHALFLEWYCIQAVRDAGRYSDENGTGGTHPHTPPPLEADCLEIFETAATLIATLGYPMFVQLKNEETTTNKDQLFVCKRSGSDGRGLYTGEGFVVLKGSSGRVETTPSMKKHSSLRARQKTIDAGIMKEESGRLVFQKDHLFNSPSMAATVLSGSKVNGWTNWKTADGRTLDKIHRQTANAS